MDKIKINSNNDLLELLKKNNIEELNKQIVIYSENEDKLFEVLKTFIDKGFITTSCSKGHDNEKWKDPVYIAIYLDYSNINKILNFIKCLNDLLTDKEKEILYYTFNFNTFKSGEDFIVDYMFGIQINLFEDSEDKFIIYEKIKSALKGDLTSGEVKLNYNFIYVVNRFVHYQLLTTNWLNISFCAKNLSKGFSLIFKKKADDKYVIEKDYSFDLGIEEFEYLMTV
ncbi:MAG: hypothetical protein IJZ29_05645 [Clostridia bacterium]|nr:hypothetical protein [Clostridia bacterium]